MTRREQRRRSMVWCGEGLGDRVDRWLDRVFEGLHTALVLTVFGAAFVAALGLYVVIVQAGTRLIY